MTHGSLFQSVSGLARMQAGGTGRVYVLTHSKAFLAYPGQNFIVQSK